MIKILAVLLTGLFFEAIGVVFLSKGLKEIYPPEAITAPEVVKTLKSAVTNVHFLAGVFFEALFFGTLLYLMSRAEVSLIWPLTALGFVFTTLAARFFLHEQVSLARWAGVFLIMLGAGLITWSEKVKTEAAVPSPSPESAEIKPRSTPT